VANEGKTGVKTFGVRDRLYLPNKFT